MSRINGVRLLAFGCWVLALLSAGGCGGGSTKPPAKNTSNGTSSVPRMVDDVQCEKLVENALAALQPANLGISSDRDTAISLLNQWGTSCGQEVIAAGEPTGLESPLIARLAVGEMRERMTSPHFSPRDGSHIRDCLWYEQLVERAAAETPDDLGRAVSLFYYVVRNLALPRGAAEVVPQPLFELCLLGRGTAEDRAWLFAGLLRPLQIDAVILRPVSAGEEGAWLVGVLLKDEVYLFDPRLGLPIPSRQTLTADALVRQPATLGEAIEDESVLRQLDVAGRSYPLRSADLKSLRVELIGDSSLWSERMLRLQMGMAGEQGVGIFDGLADSPIRKGMFGRVVEHGKRYWQEESIGVWPHPESRLSASEDLSLDQHDLLARQMRPFDAPVPIASDQATSQFVMDEETGLLKFLAPLKQHLKARTIQLAGDAEDVVQAIRVYVSIRLWGGLPPVQFQGARSQRAPGQPGAQAGRETTLLLALRETVDPDWAEIVINTKIPPEQMELHRVAGEQAFFWIGVSQMEMGKDESAAETFRDFLQRHAKAALRDEARYLLGVSLAQSGALAEAIEVLEGSGVDDPQRWGNAVLVRRWRGLGEEGESGKGKAAE